MDIDKYTEKLWKIPWATPDIPDPIDAPFGKLEKQIKDTVNELWGYREQIGPHASKLHPIWPASLRMTIMYLNMSEAFYECGEEFLITSLNEPKFLKLYQNSEKRSKLERAARLLARSVGLIRAIGFKSPLISIDGDHHYYGRRCKETNELFERLKRQVDADKDSGNKDREMINMCIKFLIKIGVEDGFIGSDGKSHGKATEIGKILNKVGGIELMQGVAGVVVGELQSRGFYSGRELEHCWHGIGEWMA